MMKKIIIMTAALVVVCGSMAQTAKILSTEAAGYVAKMEAGTLSSLDLVVKVTVESGKVGNSEAGCMVLMNNAKLPQINTATELLEAAQKCCIGGVDLTASDGMHKQTYDVPLSMENLSGKEATFYVQAFVMCDEENPRMLAKSNVVPVDPGKLQVLSMTFPEEELNHYSNVVRSAIGMGIDQTVGGLEGRVASGQVRCTTCGGKGRIEKGGAEKWKEDCPTCKGTGLMDSPDGDNHSSMEAPAGFLDAWGKAREYRNKQVQSKNSRQRK